MRIDTGIFGFTASALTFQKEQLLTVVDESIAKVNSLSGSWKGKAADATISAYSRFASRKGEEYNRVLQEYVTFLGEVEKLSYEGAERKIICKADEI